MNIFHQIKVFILNLLQGDLSKLLEPDFNGQGLGQYILEERTALNLSLRDLEKLGKEQGQKFSYTYVFKLEHGQIKNPDKEMVSKVLKALGKDDKDTEKVLRKFGLL